MAVQSFMVPLGTPAPEFALPDVAEGKTVRLQDFTGTPLLVAFVCNHCPYVKHIEDAFGALLTEFPQLNVVGISSNDIVSYPEDAPEKLIEQATRANWTFPYLFDETQEVARNYQAACTPDFFLYDAEHALAYRGAFDQSTPGNGKPIDGDHLRDAIQHVLAGKAVPEPHLASMGCSIKFRA
ncbi:MAG: thioredoxin family protein [Corynebacteriales bacterium]|nr:thioredoxin family protein [Mycobacteriales bacterium]